MRKILIMACILFLGLAFTMVFAQTDPPDPVEQNIQLIIPQRTVLHVANPGGDWNINLRDSLVFCYRISKAQYDTYRSQDTAAALEPGTSALRNHLNTDGTIEGLDLATTYPPVWTTTTTNDTKGYLICIRDPGYEKVVQVYSNTIAQRDVYVELKPVNPGRDVEGFGGFYLGAVKKGTPKKKLSELAPAEQVDMLTRKAETPHNKKKIASINDATGQWEDYRIIEARLLDGTEKVPSGVGEQTYQHKVVFTAVIP